MTQSGAVEREDSVWADRSVVVTGGTGFIGRHLCRRLTDLGAKVGVVSRSDRDERASSFGLERVSWHRTGPMEASPNEPSEGNAVCRSLFEELQPEVVFHLAGLVKGTRDRDTVLPMMQSNLETAVRWMDAAAHVGCSRFVQAGSLEEPDDLESAPASPYAASKLAASAYARLFAAQYGLSTAVARIFMVYGPGPQDENKLVPYVIRRLLAGEALELSGGTRPVDWIFVEDVAEGLVALADSDAPVAELGSGELNTVRDVVERIANEIGHDGDLPFGSRADRREERVRRAEIDRNRIDWRPKTGLAAGLQRTVEWFRRPSRP